MTEELLPYYNTELASIRRLAAGFAKAHPKIAGRLRMGTETVEDPHVSRLIESVAFLNARMRRKLDDDFPELTDALLEILYPHYLAPVPSMAIVQLECDPELTAPHLIEAGSMVETERIQGEPVRFSTVYPVETYPIQVASAEMRGTPFEAPRTHGSATCAGVIRITLKTASSGVGFQELAPERLRFFLHGGEQVDYPLYEFLFRSVREVAIATSPRDGAPQILSSKCIQPVGFGRHEGMLPYSPRSFPGYGLLTEFFHFPEKFLFFDVVGISVAQLKRLKGTLELFLYLDRTSAELEQTVSTETFRLGCTPVVNLFKKRAEPIQITQRDHEYHVVPDARRPLGSEVYSVDRVTATNLDGSKIHYLPFFGLHHGAEVDEDQPYWCSHRSDALRSDGLMDTGTEVYLRLVDPSFEPLSLADGVLSVETTCLNRDLPAHLPFGGGQPRLQLADGRSPIKGVHCLTAPTRTIRPSHRDGHLWHLVSHLSLNHLTLEGEHAVQTLREILDLYNYTGSTQNKNLIAGIARIETCRATIRVHDDGIPGICRGTEVRIHFNEDHFAGSGLFLFASVLERFLALYGSINTFTRLVATSTRRQEEVHRWAPRAGERALL